MEGKPFPIKGLAMVLAIVTVTGGFALLGVATFVWWIVGGIALLTTLA